MRPIGVVRRISPDEDDRDRSLVTTIEIEEALEPALAGIEEWSHIYVLFWMERTPGREEPILQHEKDGVGILAARSPIHPNPIGLTLVELVRREGNVLWVRGLDAYDGTPVLDVKPYPDWEKGQLIVVTDFEIPGWLKGILERGSGASPMSQLSEERTAEFYAQTYDQSVPDWPGEMDFYQGMAAEVKRSGGAVLEVASGTGRVAIRLAQQGVSVVGLDLSPQMLEVAREKTAGLENVRWVQADMRSFELGQTFDLVIIPGHAFQNLNTPQDQVACLECIRRHLHPGGLLVVHLDHQDVSWLGELLGEKGGRFEKAEQFRHPESGRQVRTSRSWSYEPAGQTAICQTVWEELETDGRVVNRWQTRPIRLHCVFRFEMEHLLARAGFAVEAVYGDFSRHALGDDSSEMVWVARRSPQGG